MKGTVTTHLAEKRYGFIKGEDGKDYFFHENDFPNKSQVKNICENAIIEFEQHANVKGYTAKKCNLISDDDVMTYTLPDNIITSKTDHVRGWNIVQRSEWKVHGSSRDSPDGAKKDAIEKAKRIGTGALIDFQYYKTTKSEGNYHYTMHHFSGRAVTVSKKCREGKYKESDLSGLSKLNHRSAELKKELQKETSSSNDSRGIAVMSGAGLVLLAFSLFIALLKTGLIQLLIISSFLSIPAIVIMAYLFLTKPKEYDKWLQHSPCTSDEHLSL